MSTSTRYEDMSGPPRVDMRDSARVAVEAIVNNISETSQRRVN